MEIGCKEDFMTQGGRGELSVQLLRNRLEVEINVVLSSKPFKAGSGDTNPNKTNLMNKM